MLGTVKYAQAKLENVSVISMPSTLNHKCGAWFCDNCKDVQTHKIYDKITECNRCKDRKSYHRAKVGNKIDYRFIFIV